MYDQSSILIAALLFGGILLAIEAGFWIGLRSRATATASVKSQIAAIQAAALGVLALLLAFTFSLALQRYDNRSQAVVDEANAIGTAYLRAQLLPPSLRLPVGELLREYLEVRVEAGRITVGDKDARRPFAQRADRITEQLWTKARQAAEIDGGPVASGLFIQSLNEMIDAYGKRKAALDRHVPELVLSLLFVAFLITGSILGYVSGLENNRARFATTMMVSLLVLLVFLTIDLDRPRRGFIQVDQESLEELQRSVVAGKAAWQSDGASAKIQAPRP